MQTIEDLFQESSFQPRMVYEHVQSGMESMEKYVFALERFLRQNVTAFPSEILEELQWQLIAANEWIEEHKPKQNTPTNKD